MLKVNPLADIALDFSGAMNGSALHIIKAGMDPMSADYGRAINGVGPNFICTIDLGHSGAYELHLPEPSEKHRYAKLFAAAPQLLRVCRTILAAGLDTRNWPGGSVETIGELLKDAIDAAEFKK